MKTAVDESTADENGYVYNHIFLEKGNAKTAYLHRERGNDPMRKTSCKSVGDMLKYCAGKSGSL